MAENVAIGGSVALVIKPTGGLHGTVEIAGRGPPEHFRISLDDEDEGHGRVETFWRTGGRWSMRDLPAGKLQVSAQAREGTAQTTVTLTEGQSRENIRLVLEPRATLRGQVLALDTGKPLSGMRVMAQAAGQSPQFSVGQQGDEEQRKQITDGDGRFEVSDAPAGKLIVYVMPTTMEEEREYEFGFARTTLQAGQQLDLPPIRCARRRVNAQDRGGDLGFELKDVAPSALADPVPLRVAVVRPGGPAAGAGLKVGDVITSIDGQDVTGALDYLYWTISRVPEGTRVTLGLARGTTLSITASAQP